MDAFVLNHGHSYVNASLDQVPYPARIVRHGVVYDAVNPLKVVAGVGRVDADHEIGGVVIHETSATWNVIVELVDSYGMNDWDVDRR